MTDALASFPAAPDLPDAVPPVHGIAIKLEVEGFEPCPHHAPEACECEKVSIGKRCKEGDLGTQQLAQIIQLNILALAVTITDTASATHAETANSASTAPTILAGTTGTSATVQDRALGGQTETISGTVNAVSGTGSSCSFTVTGVITATADRAYAEVGLRVTIATHLYLICHDSFSTLNVSNTGTLAVTYTITVS